MMGRRHVMQEALFYGFSLERRVGGYLERHPAILSAPWVSQSPAEIGSDWLARSLRRLLRSGEERAKASNVSAT